MSVEELLRTALAEEADARDVDLHRLHAETVARRVDAAPPRRGAGLLIAACLLLVAGTAVAGAWLAGLGLGRGADVATDTPDEGHVDTSFTCARQRTWPFEDGRVVGDDGFVPDLSQGPATMARLVRAPRYVLEVEGDTATLRLGNADGSLASRSRFVRGDGGWVPVEALTCAGDGSPLLTGTTEPDRLTDRPPTPGALDERPLTGKQPGSVLVDRRGFYDVSGLLHDRTVWATPCGRKLCVRAGVRDSYAIAEVAPGTPPSDLSTAFLPPDDMVGIAPPYAFVVVHQPDATVTWRDTAGTVHEAQRIGDAWYVLAPHDTLAEVVVQPRGGEPRGWTLDEMR